MGGMDFSKMAGMPGMGGMDFAKMAEMMGRNNPNSSTPPTGSSSTPATDVD
jgi:hypothetical protein